jgi:serine/threonine protein kinase
VVKELKSGDSSQQQHSFLRQVSSAEQTQRHREAVAALFKEAAMMEASRHSSVVQCLALCKQPPALVMEWCRGGSLSQPNNNFLASASALDIVRLLHNAAGAVAHLHSHQRRCGRALVHGDLRACNVMLQSQSGPDWGIKVGMMGSGSSRITVIDTGALH